MAAFALGLGASGMTFLDSEIPALLGLPLAGLLFTCLGHPPTAIGPADSRGAGEDAAARAGAFLIDRSRGGQAAPGAGDACCAYAGGAGAVPVR
ncbi:MAG: hypothetical protein JO179_19105 [Solirubrobacterales bacterium]|nr:hypothetical protein [Solirubrobacterales bacterium]